VNLEAARTDLGLLLTQYQDVVEAAALWAPVPHDLVASVIRAADHWRFRLVSVFSRRCTPSERGRRRWSGTPADGAPGCPQQ
jgi:hypothetical protein